MRKTFAIIALATLVLTSAEALAQNEEPKQKDVPTIAAEAADFLMQVLKLEDYQVFQVDSTLQYNYAGLMAEYDAAKKAGATSVDSYQLIQDKWMNANDTTFFRIFDEKQWAKYLKCSYGRDKKARDKRMKARAAK